MRTGTSSMRLFGSATSIVERSETVFSGIFRYFRNHISMPAPDFLLVALVGLIRIPLTISHGI